MQTIGRLKPLVKLIEQRTGDARTARVAFGMVVAALTATASSADGDSTDSIGDRLLAQIATMRTLIDETEV